MLVLLLNQVPAGQTLPLSGIASGEAFGAASISGGAASLNLTGIASAEAFGTFTVAGGPITVNETGIASAEALGAPSVAGGNAALAGTAIPSGEAFGTVTLSNFTVLLPAGISSAEAFGAPSLTGGTSTIAQTGIGSAEAFGASLLSSAVTLPLAGISSAEAFGAVTQAGNRAFGLSGLASAEAFGVAAVVINSQFSPLGISSAEAFGTPTIVGSFVFALGGISSGEVFGGPGLSGGESWLTLTGIPSAEAFGPVVLGQPLFLQAPSIPSAEGLFSPRITPAKPVRVITFPNGQVLTSMALTPQAINITLQTLTCWMLGCDPASDPQAYYKVRLEWPTQGQPAWDINEDICFLRATEEDGEYNKIRDRKLSYQDSISLESTDTYTRIWRVSWSFYGPNSFDNARQVKSALMSLDFVSDQLADMSLYLDTQLTATTRNPEKFGSQWWERTDLSVRMNELVTESLTVSTIASAEVILIENDRGQVADITI